MKLQPSGSPEAVGASGRRGVGASGRQGREGEEGITVLQY